MGVLERIWFRRNYVCDRCGFYKISLNINVGNLFFFDQLVHLFFEIFICITIRKELCELKNFWSIQIPTQTHTFWYRAIHKHRVSRPMQDFSIVIKCHLKCANVLTIRTTLHYQPFRLFSFYLKREAQRRWGMYEYWLIYNSYNYLPVTVSFVGGLPGNLFLIWKSR